MDNLPKLVRDKIPDIIRENGKECEIEIADGVDYLIALDKKLDEEVAEYHESHSLEELADILEVIYAATKTLGHSVNDLHDVYWKKHFKRGGLFEGIILKRIYDKEKDVNEKDV